MAGENSSEFRFDGNEPEQDSFYHEELKDLRVEKLSQRVTLLTILLPCLIAVAIYFGYQNLTEKVSRSDDAGSLEIQRLANNIDDLAKSFNEKLITFSTTLSTQDKDFGTSIEGRLFTINKKVENLQGNFKSISDELARELKQNQETIEKLKISKVDKKSQAVAVEKINAAIKPLKSDLQKLKTIREDLKSVSEDIKNLESDLSKKLEAAAAQNELLVQENEQVRTSLSELSGETVNKDSFALEVLKLKKYFQSQLSEEVTNLNQKLQALQKEIAGVEKISRVQKQSMKKVSKKTISQPPGITQDSGSDSTTLPTQSGTITEKDLIE